VRHAARPAFENIKIGQFVEARDYSRKTHDLRAAWAMRRIWRGFVGQHVTHGQSDPTMSPDTLTRWALGTRSGWMKTRDLRTKICSDAPCESRAIKEGRSSARGGFMAVSHWMSHWMSHQPTG
jgi:hypothetical protein